MARQARMSEGWGTAFRDTLRELLIDHATNHGTRRPASCPTDNPEIGTVRMSSEPASNDQVTVGDLDSSARGTGARKSAGKPDLHQLPWWTAADLFEYIQSFSRPSLDCMCERAIHLELMRSLGAWQAQRAGAHLYEAAWFALELLKRETGESSLNPRCLIPVVRVLEFGAKKYRPGNWAKGMPWSVCFNSAMSHLTKRMAGHTIDDESGLSHEAHLMCNLLFLLAYRGLYPEGDDRLKEFQR